jgi:Ca-activated chloride channel homolog
MLSYLRGGRASQSSQKHSRERAISYLLLSVLAVGAYATEGQERVAIAPRAPSRETRNPPSMRLDVGVVLIPVSVTDPLDRPVTTLRREDFRVMEDGVEQKITSFSQEDVPTSAGLVFDTSGSMRTRIDQSIAALHEFFNMSIPGDEFFLVGFSDEPRVLTGFTTEPAQIYGKLGVVQPEGWTALLDAIYLGIHKMKPAKNSRKVLLVLSDGADNNSRFTLSEVKTLALEADVRIFAVGLFSRPRLLQELAEETGGRMLEVRKLAEMPETVRKLSEEIRSQYVLGYSSSDEQNDGKYRRVRVEVASPTGLERLRVSWRRGYYAPYR